MPLLVKIILIAATLWSGVYTVSIAVWELKSDRRESAAARFAVVFVLAAVCILSGLIW